MSNPCQCGCGGEARFGNRFIHGHNGAERAKRDRYVVNSSTGCWDWIGGRSCGYGVLRFKAKHWHAHRFFYVQRYGELDDDRQLHHLCHNRACVNPDHLEAVSADEHAGGLGHGKLTRDTASAIRRLYAAGATQQAVADCFGVSRTTVSNTVNRKIWKAAV